MKFIKPFCHWVFLFCFVLILNIFYQIPDIRISVRVSPQHVRQTCCSQFRVMMVHRQGALLASRHHNLLFPLVMCSILLLLKVCA